MPMPAYDPQARCPKCGHDRVGTRWKVAKPGQPFDTGVAEWLMRHCERCEFNWDEACIEGEFGMSRDERRFSRQLWFGFKYPCDGYCQPDHHYHTNWPALVVLPTLAALVLVYLVVLPLALVWWLRAGGMKAR